MREKKKGRGKKNNETRLAAAEIIWRAERKGNDRKISRWNFVECNCSLRVNLAVRCFYPGVLFTPRLRPSLGRSQRRLRSYARAYASYDDI